MNFELANVNLVDQHLCEERFLRFFIHLPVRVVVITCSSQALESGEDPVLDLILSQSEATVESKMKQLHSCNISP